MQEETDVLKKLPTAFSAVGAIKNERNFIMYPDNSYSTNQPTFSENLQEGPNRPDNFLNTLGTPNPMYSAPKPEYVPAEERDLVPNLSMSRWLLVNFILSIPIVGFVFLIIWSIGDPGPGKEALVTFARGTIVWKVIGAIIYILFMFFVLYILSTALYGMTDAMYSML